MAFRASQTAFVGGVISPALEGRTDLDKYAFCLKTGDNMICSRWGSAMNRPGTLFIGEVRDSTKATRLIGFEFSVTQNYVLELGDAVLRPIKDQGQVLESSKNITGATQANPVVITSNAHGYSNGDVVFLDALGGMTQLNERTFIVASSATNTFALHDMFGDAVDGTAFTAYTSGGTVSRLYQLTLPYASTEVFAIGYAQTADTLYACHQGYAVRKITRSGHANWSINSVTFGPVQAAPTSPGVSASPSSGATVNSYVVTAFDETTGEESLASSVASAANDLTVAGNKNTISWTGASGATRYNVYKAQDGIYGFIGGTTDVSFIDDNISPDLGNTPPTARNPFSSSSNYPGVCDFHEGRLWFANTLNTPGGVWSSQSNRYENLNVSVPAKADDAVSFELRPGVNAVRSIASIKDMCLFTSNAEHTAKGGGVTDFITPASLVVQRHSRRGSASIDSLVVGDLAFFIQRQSGAIRAFGYSFQKDGYRSDDLTLLAPHLFAGHTIVDWCYQQEPHSAIWCVRDDGVVLSLVFVEEQNVTAWSPHYFGGSFGTGDSATGYGVAESCTCIEGDTEDEVYFVVKRTIGGVTKRYIEMLSPRWNGDSDDIRQAYFYDCGIIFTAAAATSVITGLAHLEGQSVMALVDGNVQGPFTVSSAQITLTTAMVGTDADPNSQASVGLSYVSDVEDLPVSMQTQEGAPQGRAKAINSVVLKLRHSRGIKYGQGSVPNESDDQETARIAKLTELKQRQLENWNDPTEPYSGDTNELIIDGAWDLNGSVLLRQEFGLPMEIVAIYKDIVVGG